MAPCLAPVLHEGLEGAALDAVGEMCDGGADDLVAAANGEGLRMLVIKLEQNHTIKALEHVLEACSGPHPVCNSPPTPTPQQPKKENQPTIPCPVNSESVLRIQYADE